MNKTLLSLSLTVLTVVPSSAQEHLQREAVASSAEKSFTVVMQLPVTSIKNQYRSGTCWDYATPSAAACLSPGSYNSNVHLTPKTILSRLFFFLWFATGCCDHFGDLSQIGRRVATTAKAFPLKIFPRRRTAVPLHRQNKQTTSKKLN